MNELKPCPFCGGTDIRIKRDLTCGFETFSMQCMVCDAPQNYHDSERGAIDAWNTRAERTCTFEPESSGLLGQYKCSSCNDTVHVASLKVLKRLHYCPNCGARVVEQ